MTERQLVEPRGKMTPFAFYVFICMDQAKKKHPGKELVFQMFEDVCLPRWENMSDFHKKRFVTMAEKDVARFNEEMETYENEKKAFDEEKKAMQEEEKAKKVLGRKKKEDKKVVKKVGQVVKKKKDPNAPKGLKRAYSFFCQETVNELGAAGINSKETFKECGRRWKEISPSQKSRFEEMAAKDKERFKTEQAKYEAEKETGDAVASKAQQGLESEEARGSAEESE